MLLYCQDGRFRELVFYFAMCLYCRDGKFLEVGKIGSKKISAPAAGNFFKAKKGQIFSAPAAGNFFKAKKGQFFPAPAAGHFLMDKKICACGAPIFKTKKSQLLRRGVFPRRVTSTPSALGHLQVDFGFYPGALIGYSSHSF